MFTSKIFSKGRASSPQTKSFSWIQGPRPLSMLLPVAAKFSMPTSPLP